ncbi:MAG: cytidylate kinase-like family protein [Lachnospira sp.]|nr:cytidylate kinase-like family protein [Lachnospira sp.]
MERQVIISVGREYGSGGHEIAEMIAKHYGIPLYDKEIFQYLNEEGNIDETIAKEYDEKPMSLFTYATERDAWTMPLQDKIAKLTFDFLKKKAQAESFVIVGRCAEDILRDNPALVSIFVRGDVEIKKQRVIQKYHLEEKEALQKMKSVDKMRRTYHNFYSEGKWGDSRNYDICINSSKFGIEGTVKALIGCIGE